MTKILTYDELIAALQSLQDAAVPALLAGMEVAAAVVEGEAKKNCTPGHSPYENMVFPTKLDWAIRHGHDYTGAPYSYDDDPWRALIHMRDTIYSEADADQTRVMGFVGTPKDYALYVHEGTSKMWARPFLTDAIQAKQRVVREILGEALWDGLYATAGVDQL